MLGVLARHVNFEPLLKEIVPERERRGIQKSLDAIVMQNQMWCFSLAAIVKSISRNLVPNIPRQNSHFSVLHKGTSVNYETT